MRFLVVLLLFACPVALASGSDGDKGPLSGLYVASNAITDHADRTLITASLYQQMRPRVLVTRSDLGNAQIDGKVRSYIAEKYTPALIGNYAYIYGKMRKGHNKFGSCDHLQGFAFSEDIQAALCVIDQKDRIRVNYMTNGYGQGWKQGLAFIFHKGRIYTLVGIELNLPEGQKVHIQGL